MRPFTAAGVHRAEQGAEREGPWPRPPAVICPPIEGGGALPGAAQGNLQALFGKGRGQQPLDRRDVGLHRRG